MFKVLVGLLLFVLVACSPVETYRARPELLKDRSSIDLTAWMMNGRLLIKGQKVMTANINWQHKLAVDKLKLAGTLGLGAIYIELNEQGILIDKGYGNKQTSKDIDVFIAQQIGFIVPVTALRWWVVGMPMEGVPVVWFDDGFEQLGWQVIYSSFMSTRVGKMPHKVKVVKDKINLKLVVDKWEFE